MVAYLADIKAPILFALRILFEILLQPFQIASNKNKKKRRLPELLERRDAGLKTLNIYTFSQFFFLLFYLFFCYNTIAHYSWTQWATVVLSSPRTKFYNIKEKLTARLIIYDEIK